MATQRPSLGLELELVFPDGTTKRLDGESKGPDKPTGITFKTQRYTGFADANATLSRAIDQEYADLGLLNEFNLIGYDGSIAYEGTLGSQPRSLEGTPKIMLQAAGWMSHAKDQSFVEVFIDRDLSKWVAPSARRVAALIAGSAVLGSSGTVNDESGTPAIELSINGKWVSPYKPAVEAWWLPRAGVNLGAIFYDLSAVNANIIAENVHWVISASLSSDDAATVVDSSGNLWPTTPPKTGYLSATGTRTAAIVGLSYNETPSGAENATFYARMAKLAVYGTHGLTRRGEDPGGFYVSDIIKSIAAKAAPKLDTSGVEETTLPIPQASFLEDTLPYDAFQTLNAYHRWEMNVYEGKKLLYYPIDRTDYDWEVRESDPGTTVSLQGDDVLNLCSGVVVRYRSLTTGYEERLTPAAHPELRDESPDNPANLNGRPLYQLMSLSVPTTEEVALQAGRIYLSEFNQAKSPGSITIKGHVRDRAGHWQPAWKVRSSDRLIIADMPNDSVRVVAETSYDHDSKTVTIGVDSSMKRLDAILARLGVAVEASGLSLP